MRWKALISTHLLFVFSILTNQSCHVNATCTNTKTSYVCTCHPRYVGDGSYCTGTWCLYFVIILTIKTLWIGWQDRTTFPYYNFLFMFMILQISYSCHVNATCTNNNGSYICECHPGFNGNGQNCTGEFNLFAIIFRILLSHGVQLKVSLFFSFLHTTYYLGTSSDLTMKVWVTLIKVTLTELSISNLRYTFTLN